MQAQSVRFSDLEVGRRVSGFVCAWECDVSQTRTGAPFLRLKFRDIDATLLEGRMWDAGEDHAPQCPVVVEVDGTVDSFNGKMQLKVERLEVTGEDLSLYVPTTYRPARDLEDELTGLIALIRDAELRRLVDACLDRAPRFWTAPAAIQFHGAYRGGLLEHTLHVVRLCIHAAGVYGSRVNQDLLIAAAVLHDIGKSDAYDTPEGRRPVERERLLGHVVSGVMFVNQVANEINYNGAVPLDDLLHTLLSHHGEPQFGAPVAPCTPESLILSNADRMEADVTGCFDHWRDQPSADPWSYWKQRQRWIRRPVIEQETAAAVIDDLPF